MFVQITFPSSELPKISKVLSKYSWHKWNDKLALLRHLVLLGDEAKCEELKEALNKVSKKVIVIHYPNFYYECCECSLTIEDKCFDVVQCECGSTDFWRKRY